MWADRKHSCGTWQLEGTVEWLKRHQPDAPQVHPRLYGGLGSSRSQVFDRRREDGSIGTDAGPVWGRGGGGAEVGVRRPGLDLLGSWAAGIWAEGRQRPNANAIAFDDHEEAGPGLAAGKCRYCKQVVGDRLRPRDPQQDDTARSRKAGVKGQLAEVSVTGDHEAPLGLGQGQQHAVRSPFSVSRAQTTS